MSTGLTFPEFQIQGSVQAILDALADPAPRLLEAIVRACSEDMAKSIRTALDSREHKVRVGWGGMAPDDWLVTITMATSQKGNSGRGTLGDIVGNPYEVALAARTLQSAITAEASIPLTFTAGTPPVGTNDVTERGLVRLRAGAAYEYATYRIQSGVCTLTYRGILTTVARAWDAGTEVIFFDWEQLHGWPEDVTMRLDVGGINETFVTIIGRIVQAILVRDAVVFAEAGYTLMDCSATDLAPRPPIWPAHWFNRTVSVRFASVLALPLPFPGIADASVTTTPEGI